MGERYVDVGKVRSRSGPLRSVRAPAHPARSQPPLTASAHSLRSQPPLTASTRSLRPRPPLAAFAHFAASFTELGCTPARNRFKGLSGHPPVGLYQPRRDSPRPQEAPGRPTSTDVNRHRHAAERSAKPSSGVAVRLVGPPSGPTASGTPPAASSQFLYQGSPPRSLSETTRVRSRACRISRFTPASAIDTASCRSS